MGALRRDEVRYRRGMMQPPMLGWGPPQEVTLYQDAAGVTVTSSRLVVGATVYPIRGLTAVQYVELPKSHGPSKLLAVLSVFAFMVNASDALVGGLILAVFLFALAIVIAVKTKPELAIRVLTAGGQIDAVVTKDRARADQIVAALNRAVAGG